MATGMLNSNDERILGALAASDRPLSAYDILEQVRSGGLKAPVQVYRSLAKLQRQGLVHRIEALNAFIRCCQADHGGHRPGFVVCRDCGRVREFEDQRMAAIAESAAGADFDIERISVEVLGHCGRCRGAAASL